MSTTSGKSSIEVITKIKAPIDLCFDLATSLDLHMISTSNTNEKAIGAKSSGLVKLNDIIVWEATHFGIRQQLTSLISEYDRPFHFADTQVSGAFKSFYHDHFFSYSNGETEMIDRFNFESPLGILGKMFNNLILTSYMTNFLTQRNQVIKAYAESGKWVEVLRT